MRKKRRQKLGDKNARPTIGLFTAMFSDPDTAVLWTAVDDAARELGANALCFPGGALNEVQEPFTGANVLYELASVENLDGLVIWGALLASSVGPEGIDALCERYRPLPMVSVGLPLKGIPSVLLDNYQGVREAVIHLIEVHGYRSIAFIRGPEANPEAEERYRAYANTLDEYGISLDPALVAPGNFSQDSGTEAVRLLLDERKLLPRKNFEVIMGADDITTFGALEELQARGIRVPDDVAVIGFDDVPRAGTIMPPLTTVRAPFYEQGWRAVEVLLAQLKGEEVPEQVIVPLEVVVRRSCGCLDPTVVQAAAGCVTPSIAETFEAAFAARRGHILSEMAEAVGGGAAVSEWTEQLLDAFSAELVGDAPSAFLSALEEVLRQAMMAGDDVAVWQDALSTLRRHVLPCLSDDGGLSLTETLSYAESLLGQARVLVGGTARRIQAYQSWLAEQRTAVLHEVGQSLITTFDVKEVMGTLVGALPQLGIPSCFLSLYEDPESPTEWARLILALDESRRIELEAGGRRFLSRQLVPDGLLPQDRRYSMVVEPLLFQEDQIGFVLFEANLDVGMSYYVLGGQLSNALRGALLVQEHEQAAEALRKSEERYRSILEDIEDGYYEVDLAGNMTFFNEPLRRMYRYPKDELMGMNYRHYTDEETAKAVFKTFNTVYQTGKPDKAFGWEFTRKDGTRMFVEASVSLISGPTGEPVGFRGIVRDVSERRQAEAEREQLLAEVQESERQLQAQVEQVSVLNQIGQVVTQQLDLEQLLETVYQQIRRVMSVDAFFVALYDTETELVSYPIVYDEDVPYQGPPGVVPPSSKLRTIIDSGEPLLMNRTREEVASLELNLTSAIGNVQKPSASLLYVPLHRGQQTMGVLSVQSYILDAYDAQDVAFLTSVAGPVASAIENARLFEQTRHRSLQLQAAAEVSRTASSLLDVEELIQASVDLIRDQFDFYYVGLFLLDEDGELAVLRAGTGEAGRAMLDSGHELEIGGQSMIGQSVAQRRARIAQDVGEEGQRFDNPFLPDTRSEMALPLISRGQAIGALTVQSTEMATFSDEDIVALQAMADQLANAIANAQQLQATDRARAETDKRVRELACLNDIGRKVAESPSVEELLSWLAERIPSAMQYPSQCVVAFEYQGEIYGLPEAKTLPSQIVQSLSIRGQIAGRVSIAYTEGRGFLDEESALLGDIARRVGNYIENILLFEEASSRAERLAVVNRVARTVGAALHLDELMETVYQEIASTFQPDAFFIALYEEEADELDFRFMVEDGARVSPGRVPVGGLTSFVVSERKPLAIRDLEQERVDLPAPVLIGAGGFAASWMGVPMLIGERLIGVINVQSGRPHAWDKEDEQLLVTIADQVAVAVDSARLFEEARIRAEELAVLNELGQALAARLNVDQILDETYRGVSRLMDATNFYIGLYDPEKDEIAFVFDVTESEIDRQITVISASEGITGHIIRNRQSVLIQENLAERLAEMGIDVVGEVPLSWIGVPLIVGDRVLGVMGLQSFSQSHAYDEHGRDLLTAVASQAAIALQNAYLFEQTGSALSEAENLAQEQTVLSEMSRELSSLREIDAVIESAHQHSSRLIDATNFYIALYDAERDEVSFPYYAEGEQVRRAGRRRAGKGMTEHVIQTREPLLVKENISAWLAEQGIEQIGQSSESWLGAPLMVGGQVIGVVAVQSYTTPHLYDEHDRDLLSAIANQVAIAIESARLFEEAQDRAGELAMLNEMGRALSEMLDVGSVVENFYQYTSHLIDTTNFYVALYDARTDRVSFPLAYEHGERRQWGTRRAGKGLTEYVIHSRESLLVEENVAQRLGELGIDVIGQEALSWLGVPMMRGGQVIGVVAVQSYTTPRLYGEHDRDLLSAIANQVAIAIENGRLLEQARARAERERLVRTITDRIRRGTDREAIMRVTLQELGQMLGASKAVMRLGTREQLFSDQETQERKVGR